MSISKTALAAAAGIVGGGAIAGITYAAVATPATASSNVGAADSVIAATTGQPGAAAAAGLGRRALLGRLEHGQLTLRAKKGDITVDVQRGTVIAVSPTSITVKSLDRHTQSYAVTSTTRVRVGRQLSKISAVHAQDKVLVVGTAGNALRILDQR